MRVRLYCINGYPALLQGLVRVEEIINLKSKEMTLRNFIKENKEEIDQCIKNVVPNARLNYEERRLWILNDEGLYRWARSNGVKI